MMFQKRIANLKLFLIPIAALLLLGGIFIFIFTNGRPKTVATYAQVWSAVEKHGIAPTDSTDLFRAAWNDKNDSKGESLLSALTFIHKDSGVNFNFFVFKDDTAAHAARISYWRYLRYDSGRYGSRSTNQEYSSSASNFTVCWVKYDSFYTVCSRVGNTVIYAEANADSNELVKEILKEIGYQ
jgi:hypothetical protein